MILADTRHRLTRDDAQLAARLLASESGGEDDLAVLEARLADEGIDVIARCRSSRWAASCPATMRASGSPRARRWCSSTPA